MLYYSTNRISPKTDLKTAIFQSLPPDRGLYMPESIPILPKEFIRDLPNLTLPQIASKVIFTLMDGEIPQSDLDQMVTSAFNFPVVLTPVGRIQIAELWHGPTLAFKDFGARFMSRLFAYFLKNDNSKLTILTATSGDTGGAVAAGFYDAPHIDVVILYPKGKVSEFQERQITTWGNNISAISIDGTFDDCQNLVKQAFLDQDIQAKRTLSSANSINLARLIPQTVYYFEAVKHIINSGKDIVISVPSGNFGNLSAGVMAQKMGLPISHFIAATNANDIVPNYLTSGQYIPRPSMSTISNAMDVGNPSNFPRLLDLHNGDWSTFKNNISGYRLTDKETIDIIQSTYAEHDYLLDPHSAIAYSALQNYLNTHSNCHGVSISTAHPIKFESALASIPNIDINAPESVHAFYTKEKVMTELKNNYEQFKDYLMG